MGILKRTKKTEDKTLLTEKTQKVVEKKVSKKVTEKKASLENTKMIGLDHSGIILKPLISEKSATLAGSNQYVFVVRKTANRVAVASAIKQMYGITPVSVNVINVPGKKVRFGRRQGVRSDWKKAIVTLPVGKTINVYEGV